MFKVVGELPPRSGVVNCLGPAQNADRNVIGARLEVLVEDDRVSAAGVGDHRVDQSVDKGLARSASVNRAAQVLT